MPGMLRSPARGEDTLPRDYADLPALLAMEDGTPVTGPEGFARRRRELLSLFEKTMYGPIPGGGFEKSFEVIGEGDAPEGRALLRQIRLSVSTERGKNDALMLLVLPRSDAPVPVFFGLSFYPVAAALDDPRILPSFAKPGGPFQRAPKRGSRAGDWCIAEAVRRGYGIALAYAGDFAPDSGRAWETRAVSLFEKGSLWGISAWAFGLQRMADFLAADPAVDGQRLAAVGTSRLGKAALWAGACDERIALTCANVSGTCGAAMTRCNAKETAAALNASFPHWMNGAFKAFDGRSEALPVDQHALIACIAPRRIYISSADEDPWNDQQGCWDALMLSRDAFRLHGLGVIEDRGGTPPRAGEHVFSESMGCHTRHGTHGIAPEDWKMYFDYMDRYMPRR